MTFDGTFATSVNGTIAAGEYTILDSDEVATLISTSILIPGQETTLVTAELDSTENRQKLYT
jgi:hypothetical protein